MGVENTSLRSDIQWVIQAGAAAQYTYELTIHCGPTQTVVPLRITAIDVLADFEQGFADEISLECVVIRNEYEQSIFPHRDALTGTLVKRPIGVIADTTDTGRAPSAKQYRMTLKEATSEAVGSGEFMASHSEKYTELTLYPIAFQLIDLAVEQLMLMPVGGIYRKKSPPELLKSELTRLSKSLVGLDESDAIRGVEMVAPPETALAGRNHIVVPAGVRLVDLADHIQRNEGGIYDAGVGCYCARNLWWVYPVHDITRFPKESRTLTILSCHSIELPAADSTYRVDGNAVTIVANGKINHLDTTDHESVNQGNGVRFIRAQNLFDKYTDGTTKGVADSQQVMAGFVAQNRDSGKNYAPFSDQRITDNIHHELSGLAKRQGQRIQLNWDRADPSLISPGMPVRFLYEADDLVYELLGTVLNLQYQTRTDQPGMVSARYITGCGMTLFVAVARTMKA